MIGFIISFLVLFAVVLIIILPFAWIMRCKHKWFVVRTITGDERMHTGKARVYSCSKCGKVKYE